MDDDIKRVYDRLQWIEQDGEAATLILRLRKRAEAALIENAKLREDAERYRWLAERTVSTGLARWMHETGGHQFLDAAIDAARKREGA
jgi:hypothetical protein